LTLTGFEEEGVGMCSVYRRDKGWKVRKRSMSSVASGYGRKFEGSRAVVKRRCVTQLRESAGVEAWDRPRLCPLLSALWEPWKRRLCVWYQHQYCHIKRSFTHIGLPIACGLCTFELHAKLPTPEPPCRELKQVRNNHGRSSCGVY
jgi:hypothetical protein